MMWGMERSIGLWAATQLDSSSATANSRLADGLDAGIGVSFNLNCLIAAGGEHRLVSLIRHVDSQMAPLTRTLPRAEPEAPTGYSSFAVRVWTDSLMELRTRNAAQFGSAQRSHWLPLGAGAGVRPPVAPVATPSVVARRISDCGIIGPSRIADVPDGYDADLADAIHWWLALGASVGVRPVVEPLTNPLVVALRATGLRGSSR